MFCKCLIYDTYVCHASFYIIIENPVFYLTDERFIYLFINWLIDLFNDLFIYVLWFTNGLTGLQVMKCFTKVTVNLYLSIQSIYFS